MLARQPGTKEARYVHLLTDNPEAWETSPSPLAAGNDVSSGGGQIAMLEEAVARLEREIAALRKEFTEFRKQFEED